MRNKATMLTLILWSVMPAVALGQQQEAQHAVPADKLAQPRISYAAPAGWQSVPRGLLGVATLEIAENAQKGRILIMALPGEGGGIVNNVNRWRAQLGLKSLSEAEVRQSVRHTTVDGHKGMVVDISGPKAASDGAERIVAVLVAVKKDTWFFVLRGPGKLVAKHETSFDKLTQSVRFSAEGAPTARIYDNRLTPIENPAPLLADHPRYVEPIKTGPRFAAPMLIDEPGADLHVRAWRFSYNARGIIEVPNRLVAKATAIIVVHPWGVDDGQGWKSPEPAGAAFHCTPFKNRLTLAHMKDVVNPFLKAGRDHVGLVGYSLPGTADPIRKMLYRSVSYQPTADERKRAAMELAAKLRSFSYKGQRVPDKIAIATDTPAVEYFRQFRGLDASARFNNAGFWDLPIPVARPIEVAERDVVFYDGDGYLVLRDFLKKQGIRHVLLAGYSTDMCVCSTTAGYKNLAKDFDVFLVGDATLATFPAHDTPRFATTAALSFASLDLFITQVSWVRWAKTASRSRHAPVRHPVVR